jgi:hypothetical protein
MSTARSEMASLGTQTSALGAGGFTAAVSRTAATEEYTAAGAPLTQTITVS